MSITLRPYQQILADGIRSGFDEGHKRLMAVSPTGSGKTVIFNYIASNAAALGNRTFILVHRRELVQQTSKSLRENGIKHGVIAAQYPELNYPIQVCSVQTLARRLNRYKPPDLLVIDESHHATARQYSECLEWASGSHVLGVTATPIRTDGRGFDHIFSNLVLGPDIPTLIAEGWLCKPRMFAPEIPEIDLSGVGTVAGEYNRGELALAMDKAVITGSAVEHYRKHFPDMPAGVVFCTSVQHAQHVAAEFVKAGVPCEAIDGSMDDRQRQQILNRMASGETRLLASCSLIDEGFDLPLMKIMIDLSPTKSLARYIQRIGRVLRIYPGKLEAIVVDHVQNWRRHIDAALHIFHPAHPPLEWSLTGRKKRAASSKGESLTTCPECFSVFPPESVCPSCGHQLKADGGGAGRKMEEVDGQLVEINFGAITLQQPDEKPKGRRRGPVVRKLERA